MRSIEFIGEKMRPAGEHEAFPYANWWLFCFVEDPSERKVQP